MNDCEDRQNCVYTKVYTVEGIDTIDFRRHYEIGRVPACFFKMNIIFVCILILHCARLRAIAYNCMCVCVFPCDCVYVLVA